MPLVESQVLETPDSLSAAKSELFPFYHQIPDNERTGEKPMEGLEAVYKAEDQEDCKYMREYRRDSGWDDRAKRGQRIYNVLQTYSPEDEISKLFIGYVRTNIDQGINTMSEGEPDFNFEPFGPSDHMKTIVWHHLIKMVLSDCQYKLHQETFFRDYFVMGCGVFEVFIDYPQRTLRVPNDKFPGGYEHIIIQDHRRPKVGVRAVNPINCWRNPNIDATNAVPSCLRRRIITWNQMAQDFGRCKLPGGIEMYKNMDKLAKGSHACVYYYQDEIRDIYRIYIKTFGTESDGKPTIPSDDDLGICVLDKSLKIHERVISGQVLRSTGLNIPGKCSLMWGILFDKYDKDYTGNHSVYGMGLPERIEAENVAIQGMFNQHLDAVRWAGTSVLNYVGNNADSYMDVDANRLYGGELIDGTITPMPLGISRPGDFQANQLMMDNFVIPATQINHNQMVGDNSKTLGEFALRIRQASRGAEQRLTRLEIEVYKPLGSLLLANCLTTLTDDEYEALTEEQVGSAKESIKDSKKPVGDYQNLNSTDPSKPAKKRYMRYIPMKGEKIREDFTVTKKRKLAYNADYAAYTDEDTGKTDRRTTNTLIHDKNMQVETSYVPLVKEYVYPAEYIESGLMPDCIVDSRRMLADIKNQEQKNVQTFINFLLQLMQLGYKGADMDKIVAEMASFAEFDAKKFLTSPTNTSEEVVAADKLLEQLATLDNPTPPQNVPLPQQAPPQVNAGAMGNEPGGLGVSANAVQAATGGV